MASVNIPRQSMLMLSAALALCGAWGCSSATVGNRPETPTQEKLLRIGLAYGRYTAENNRPPQGPQDIAPLLKEDGNPDDILRSDRDDQPFVICWGVDTRQTPSWATSAPVLAYEKQGANDTRCVLVMFFGSKVLLMSEAEFRKASFPPGHTPTF